MDQDIELPFVIQTKLKVHQHIASQHMGETSQLQKHYRIRTPHKTSQWLHNYMRLGIKSINYTKH
jgi:hypothetical protein